MNPTICSEMNVSACSPASLDLGRKVQSPKEKAQKQTMDEAMKGVYSSTEDKQDDDVGSAMTEEFNSSFMSLSEKGRQPKEEAIPFKDWVSGRSMGKNPKGLERMESGLSVVTGYGGESNGREDLRRNSMSMNMQARKLPSSQYKGVVPDPDGDANACQNMKGAVDGDAKASFSASSSADVMACLPSEHLFDKVVTPSDVGKLNRLVIPKQHAEKYFPLDVNQSKKGVLLNFEDHTGKVWRFRYSYWSTSQSYVLTKGWTRFVKDKKLEAGDIVSFQRGSARRHHLYISWRRGPFGWSRFRVGQQPQQSKAGVVHPVKGSLSLNPFNSATQATVLCNSQWMTTLRPSSSNPNAFTPCNSQYSLSPLVNKVVQCDALWSQSRVTSLHGTLPFSLSAPPHKQTVQTRFYDINSYGFPPTDLYLSLHNSLNSSNGGTNIKAPLPFANPAPLSAAQEWESPERKAASSVDLTTKKGVRLFGITLAEPQRLSAEHHGLLNGLLPAEPH